MIIVCVAYVEIRLLNVPLLKNGNEPCSTNSAISVNNIRIAFVIGDDGSITPTRPPAIRIEARRYLSCRSLEYAA